MPNSNPQAIRIVNEKIRPIADAMGGLYNVLKSAQIEFVAEGWGALFPNDSEVIVDGSATDGRTPITNADARSFMLTHAPALITALEANANVGRDLTFKIAPNPRT